MLSRVPLPVAYSNRSEIIRPFYTTITTIDRINECAHGSIKDCLRDMLFLGYYQFYQEELYWCVVSVSESELVWIYLQWIITRDEEDEQLVDEDDTATSEEEEEMDSSFLSW